MLSSCAEHYVEQPLIVGMPYQEAREVILSKGWLPVHANRAEEDIDYRLPHFYYDAGYIEVIDCSGTGMGYCAFQFQNGKGNYLHITTKGGDYISNDDTSPTVIYVDVSDHPV